jgi:hypothetical protein
MSVSQTLHTFDFAARLSLFARVTDLFASDSLNFSLPEFLSPSALACKQVRIACDQVKSVCGQSPRQN